MVQISPYKKRIIAVSAFVLIGSLMIGTTIYQTYFQNPVVSLRHYSEIDPFTLPSIDGGNYTYAPTSYEVTMVTFMYTKCPGDAGCSLLTVNMANLHDRVDNNGWEGVQFISIDFDYINDTMADLKHYAEENTGTPYNWEFLLGNENQTNDVAEQFAFYFAPNNGSSSPTLSHGTIEGEDPYVHTMVTYMLDREGVIRKYILGTTWDFVNILNSIEFLKSDTWQN